MTEVAGVRRISILRYGCRPIRTAFDGMEGMSPTAGYIVLKATLPFLISSRWSILSGEQRGDHALELLVWSLIPSEMIPK